MVRVARQNVWRTRAATDIVERCWIERGVEGGQQCSHETGEINQEEAPETKRFRSLAATLNYMSSDGSDVQYAAKEVCTKMASPTRGSWKRLKKAGKFLKGVEKLTWKMGPWKHDDRVNVDVHVDLNWARGPERKSTNGGMMEIYGTVVKHWSRTQATRALSTAAAEYYAVVRGATEGLGMQSMMADLGVTTQVRVWTDSNAAKAIASRRGSVRLDTWN